VSVRFADSDNLSGWESRGLRFRKLNGQYAGSGSVYGAVMTWEEIDRWIFDPDIVMISCDWHPKIVPCLDLSAPEVGATEAWEMTGPGGLPIMGEGELIADFDTGIDVFHPMFFRPSEIRYDWIDVDENNTITPGVDVVDLDNNGYGTLDEILELQDGEIYDPAMTFGGNGISNADGVYQVDWDFLFNDSDGDGERDFGPDQGYTEDDPGYGEYVFHCDDVNGNNQLDVGEELILLDQSKVRAVMEPFGIVRERGVDLIEAMPDYSGHGTAVSGVLAGGEPGYSRFCGLAPAADILMGYTSYGTGMIFPMYLPWVRQMGCTVLLYEFGGWVFNYLDGSSNEELLLDSEAGLGVMQVAPAGNLNRGYKHCQLDVLSGEDVDIQVGVEIYNGYYPEEMYASFLWRDPSVEISVSLEDPYGYDVDLEGNGTVQYFHNWEVYSGWHTSPRGTMEYDFALEGTSGETIVGTWIVTVHHPGGNTIELNGNIADDASSWEGGAEWIDYRSYDKTVTWPATADSAFVLGSYSTRGYEQYIGVGAGSIQPGEISLFSGRGTRIDGVSILSIAAPGNYDVYSTRSIWGNPYSHAGYRQFSGTSAAGPHVAASAALVWQASPGLERIEVEQLLEQYAYQDEWTGQVYNDTWGWGKIRIAELIEILDVPPIHVDASLPETIALTAFPNPFNATVSLRLALDHPGLVEIDVYNMMGRKVTTLYDGYLKAGVEQFSWETEDLASGIYWVKAKAVDSEVVEKVVVLK
jgi:subtilisin family serine protease